MAVKVERKYSFTAAKSKGSDTPLVQAGGVKALAGSIRRVADKELSEKMRKASLEAAEVVSATAKGLVPRGDTKKLLGSIRASATRSQGRIHARHKRGVPYARAVHTGRYFKTTGTRTKGQPFIRKAVPKAWPRLVDRYEASLNEIAKEFKRKHGANIVKGRYKK